MTVVNMQSREWKKVQATVLLLISLLCFSPLTMQARKVKKQPEETVQVDRQREELYQRIYLQSVVEREKGNVAAQYELLQFALTVKPDAAEALFDLAQAASKGKILGEDEIERLYSKAITLTDSTNATYLEALARYEMNAGNNEEAIPICWKLTNNESKRDDAFRMLTTIYDRQQQDEELLSTLDKWQEAEGETEELQYLKMKTFNRLGRYDEELAVVEQLIREHPDNDYYPVLRAETLLGKDDTLAAWKAYEEVVAKDSANTSAEMFLVYYYQKLNHHKELLESIQKVILNNEQPTDLRVSLLKGLMKGSMDDAHLRALFNKLLQQPLRDTDIPDLYAEYLAQHHEKNASFVPVMRKILEIDPSDEQARLTMIQDGLNRKDYKQVAELCEEGMKFNPSKLIYYHLCGGALFQQKKYEESLEAYQKGVNYVKKTADKSVVSDFYASYGDALHQVNRMEEAFACYDSSLVYNPNNVISLNNYAYNLALENTRLNEAFVMSEKAIKIEPNNSIYLDTYAWVEFVRGNYQNAKTYIDKALKFSSGEAEDMGLFEHAGDIYIHLGLKKEAKAAWRKALKLGSTSPRLKKKIKTAKYIKE